MPDRVSAKEVVRKDGFYISVSLPGTTAQTASNYDQFFIVSRPMEVLEVSEVHTVASSGGTADLSVERLTSTTAPGSGTSILGADFDLTGTANTVITKKQTTLASDRTFNPGDRIGLVISGTLTSLEGVVVTLYCKNPTQGDFL